MTDLPGSNASESGKICSRLTTGQSYHKSVNPANTFRDRRIEEVYGQ
jgi:hypothetical protein